MQLLRTTSPASSATQRLSDSDLQLEGVWAGENAMPALAEVPVDLSAYLRALAAETAAVISPLSINLAIPFCQSLCYHCHRQPVVTRDRDASRRYLGYLLREIRMLGELPGRARTVQQLLLGGGTPNYFDGAELTELMHTLAATFRLTDQDDREYQIDIDPRLLDRYTVPLMRGLGFNQLLVGVHDFSQRVLAAIHRDQTLAQVEALIRTARLYRFDQLTLDLSFGLPLQTLDSLEQSIAVVVALAPDRIVYRPYRLRPDRDTAIRVRELPSPALQAAMLQRVHQALTEAGYHYLGMDLFVTAADPLLLSRQQQQLHYYPEGYSRFGLDRRIGIGPGALSRVGDWRVRNARRLPDYYRAIDQYRLPVAEGGPCDHAQQMGERICEQLLSGLTLDHAGNLATFGNAYADYFRQRLPALQQLQAEGLVALNETGLAITDRGRTSLRTVCQLFTGPAQDIAPD